MTAHNEPQQAALSHPHETVAQIVSYGPIRRPSVEQSFSPRFYPLSGVKIVSPVTSGEAMSMGAKKSAAGMGWIWPDAV